ncbi:MAG: hypothetical protein ACTH59_01260 [Pseudoalteromonas nigrifaciens]|uniref:hypothetical protein n=1 Tax=Pseudoalteromonas nigrifaciens TaxID=28109 RepID=UPI003F9689F7
MTTQLSNRLLDNWVVNIELLQKVKCRDSRLWYASKTIENDWSGNVLVIQIESNLIGRQGAAITNFDCTIPKPASELAQDTFKSPYIVDLLKVGDESLERNWPNRSKSFFLNLALALPLLDDKFDLYISNINI